MVEELCFEFLLIATNLCIAHLFCYSHPFRGKFGVVLQRLYRAARESVSVDIDASNRPSLHGSYSMQDSGSRDMKGTRSIHLEVVHWDDSGTTR